MVGRHKGPESQGEALSWCFRPEHVVGRDSKRCPMAGRRGAAQKLGEPEPQAEGSPTMFKDQQTGGVQPLLPPSEERIPTSWALGGGGTPGTPEPRKKADPEPPGCEQDKRRALPLGDAHLCPSVPLPRHALWSAAFLF